MNAAAISNTPTGALAALFSSIGRGLIWLSVRAIRAPLTTLVVVGMSVGIVSASSNALYMQNGHHPAPLFGERAMVTSAVPPQPQKIVATPKPVVQRVAKPVLMPPVLPVAPAPHTQKAVAEITHAEIKALQEKLKAFGFYTGDADGYYGPNTANAIRAFETYRGLPSVGALTPQIMATIKGAKLPRASTPVAPAVQHTNTQTGRQDDVGQIVENISNDVAEGGRKLTAIANQVSQQVTQNVVRELAKPDRLEQIAQKVAAAAEKPATSRNRASDPAYVKKVQNGLASLGFLQSKVDGVAGEDTARAIRNFEVYNNYQVTGAITPELIDLLVGAGAKI
jgi:peptidoglycan hydrolase-like protein with peptidoglycan-binding domain